MNENEIKERGAAAMRIELSQGIITVRHTNEVGPILQQWVANQGDWDRLWERIYELKAEA